MPHPLENKIRADEACASGHDEHVVGSFVVFFDPIVETSPEA